jgi:hypothetical protein
MFNFGAGKIFVKPTTAPDSEFVEIGTMTAAVMTTFKDGIPSSTILIGSREDCFDLMQTQEDKDFGRSIEKAFT